MGGEISRPHCTFRIVEDACQEFQHARFQPRESTYQLAAENNPSGTRREVVLAQALTLLPDQGTERSDMPR